MKAELYFFSSDGADAIDLTAEFMDKVIDLNNGEIHSVVQSQSPIKEGEAGGPLEAILTIIFTSKAIEFLAKSLIAALNKEKKVKIIIENKETGKSIKLESQNVKSMDTLLNDLKKLMKNV